MSAFAREIYLFSFVLMEIWRDVTFPKLVVGRPSILMLSKMIVLHGQM